MKLIHGFLAAALLSFSMVAIGQPVDADADGVDDAVDACLGTPMTDIAGVMGLKHNRYALTDEGSTTFSNGEHRKGKGGPRPVYTLADTGGCSCDQIIAALELGKGHVKFGCSRGALEDWIEELNTEPEPEPEPE